MLSKPAQILLIPNLRLWLSLLQTFTVNEVIMVCGSDRIILNSFWELTPSAPAVDLALVLKPPSMSAQSFHDLVS